MIKSENPDLITNSTAKYRFRQDFGIEIVEQERVPLKEDVKSGKVNWR